ncbi:MULTISPECIES: lytic polysaccharide monooxygenase auxiliary activity family 9 protein [Saccharothrix]|uniref:Chitin-binding protein n=2 Tax=Saccharothrix TaxID=2071 RepID=A0ABU0X0R2_9PSEU|nr:MULTISPECIES: lytic polysaccharide monooxygenase auxiliary activity family 9 protein [Saccharothrix]MDQ2585582.1 chitin-binding protein [Saccharothrix yanglingensis]MDR6595322.1 chitin-binding protein [Saccharothrix longispora]
MSLRRRIAAVAAGVLAAPLVTVVLPSAPAFAHGYISSPASRQAQCARNLVPCGDIKWEPQSVEGPKGLRSCNGGVARFAELNDNNKGWRVASTGRTVTFNWTFTARHATANYEYYVNGQRVGNFSGNNQQPPATVSHTVTLPSSGRQTVLAIWNISDTANAFYSCVDVNAG